ncbi:hypothetical protein V8E53_006180 [Lactarius tabidus]
MGKLTLRAPGIALQQWPHHLHTSYIPLHHIKTSTSVFCSHTKIENGMGDFLLPTALKIIAEDYQQGLLDCPNVQIKASSSTTSCIFNLPPKNPYSHLIRNHQNPPQNHESVLTSQPLIPELTQTLGAIITAQLGSLTNLEIYIAAAVQGMQSRGSVGSTGMLLVAECRQSLTPDGVELSGIYEPAMPVLPKSVSLLLSSCTLSLTSFSVSYSPWIEICHVRDAHNILEAVRLGVLPLITRWLSSTEREQLCLGHVFVWEEAEFKDSLEQWTNGRQL